MLSLRLPLRTYVALGVFAVCLVLIVLERAGALPVLRPVTSALYEWAVVLGAVALLLGVLNVLWLHLRRIQHGQTGWWNSLALVLMLVAVLAAGIISPAGERSPLIEWVFTSLLAPGYGALFALLVFFSAAALYQMVRMGKRGGGWVLFGLLLMLLAQMPATRRLLAPGFSIAALWVVEWPLTATLRGVLLGVGLALMLVALRTIAGRRS